MFDAHSDITRAAIEATFLLRHRSLAETVAFHRGIDRSRRNVAASRELLKRLRQSQSGDTARTWEDADLPAVAVSPFDADLLRASFRDLVVEMNLPKSQWHDLAKSLVLEYARCEQIEGGLVSWIISR
ncbi:MULTISPECIES: hypothetical protein [unclassified Mesorhizobium]|uniref:hypothetical protein n=1 Tax=unclassified Mesorhizobium TaxID=325217 RepID=UPI00112DAADA|nr:MULTISPECIES: hypothetical protein [unclassified Mesorhizobium]MBZ9701731.1 hypothetical protein [Mesorhizobium sp. CO1-1-3]MBZ9949079.1 hypothetical protein [Mesorhizobium sp. BR1-1-11]TPI99709.1 hypothetical protein FJ428_22610 [Mesorhizobium sp. B2-8-1]